MAKTTMFRKLAELVATLRGQRRENAAAYDMTAAQLTQLRVLVASDEWPVYLALADSIASYKAEALLYENDAAKNAFLRGYIAAIRELPLRTERLVQQVSDVRDRPDAADRSERAAERRRASLYGTPQWPGSHA